MIVAIIPARGGSKRVPRKNIREFYGRPMIAWAIEAATRSACFDRVVVSTEDEEIARTALAWGAEVPFSRPMSLADDFSTTVDVMAHAISALEEGAPIQAACCIYATAALVAPSALVEAKRRLDDCGADYAFSVTAYAHPIERALALGEDGVVRILDPARAATRTQDLEARFHDAGQFYWGRADAWRAGRPILGGKAIGIPVPSERAIDIDSEADWERALVTFRLLHPRDADAGSNR